MGEGGFEGSFFWGEAWLLAMLIKSYRWLDFVDGIYANWSSNLLGEIYLW